MPSRASPRRVVALTHPPQAPFELAIAGEVFGTDRPGLAARYSFDVCAVEPGAVQTPTGYSLVVSAGLELLATADTVVVPGWQTYAEPAPHEVVAALRSAHAAGARILSICSGAFLLAEAGLLDDRTATTHWRLAHELAARYPDVQVDPEVLFIDHGDVATSAGTAAGVDLCLHIVRKDHGAWYASAVARHMVMPPHREGGQTQYTPTAFSEHARPVGLAPVLDWAVANLDGPLTVATLARRAGMSSRTFARRFTIEVGESPGQWLLSQRIRAARELLERTDMTIEVIADRAGLRSPVNLRRHFHRLVGTTPAAYRSAFYAG